MLRENTVFKQQREKKITELQTPGQHWKRPVDCLYIIPFHFSLKNDLDIKTIWLV